MSLDTGKDRRSTATDDESRQWTARARRAAESALPPDRLLPDRQPAYVASWIYVFGVLTLSPWPLSSSRAASWPLRAPPGGTSPPRATSSTPCTCGASRSSSSPWSSTCGASSSWPPGEDAAGPTWITGVVSFVMSVGAAFTGYLSQQNFDSQWISTQAKDGINATGAGAFFNVMNFGQMLMWHIVLLPIAVVLLVGSMCFWSAVAASCRPSPRVDAPADSRPRAPRPTDALRMTSATRLPEFNPDRDVVEWHGRLRPLRPRQGGHHRPRGGRPARRGPGRRLLVAGRSRRSRQDRGPTANPVDFAQTAVTELDGTSATATYGPPYNDTPALVTVRSARSSTGPVVRRAPPDQHGAGLRHRPARDAARPAGSCRALSPRTTSGVADPQATWTAAYEKAVANAADRPGPPSGPCRSLRAGRGRSSARSPSMAQTGAPRRGPAELGPVLRHRLHQAAALPRRRHLSGQPGPAPAPPRATSGE